MSTQKTDPILTRLCRYRWACTSDSSVVRLPPIRRKHKTARTSVYSLVRGRIWRAALLAALASCSIGLAAEGARAATPYDDFLHKAPSLYVYTDSPANTQTMDVSGSWWSDYKQAYAKRVGIDGWPIDFVARFESMMSTGSWAVFIQENSDGTTISFFGTTDPNAYCDFSEPTVGAPTGMFGCTSHAGHDYATAEYFTHNSYGGNGCTGFVAPYNFCSDNGMNIYSHPVVGNAATDVRFWNRFVSGSLKIYAMNFDVVYPEGYAGEQIGTKPVPEPPAASPTTPPSSTPPARPPARCRRLTFIGVAGSGENGKGKKFKPRYGKRVGPIREALTKLLPAKIKNDMRSVPLNYPAVEVESLPGKVKYRKSQYRGVVELTSRLKFDPCGLVTRYVLVGYSQGANVISEVLAADLGSEVLDRIVAAVLLADPVFDPHDNRINQLGSWEKGWGGALVGLKPGQIRESSSSFPVHSYCRSSDSVCQSSKWNDLFRLWRLDTGRALADRGHKIHGDYSMYVQSAAKRLNSRIRSTISSK